jgi:hypothetical protein
VCNRLQLCSMAASGIISAAVSGHVAGFLTHTPVTRSLIPWQQQQKFTGMHALLPKSGWREEGRQRQLMHPTRGQA